MFIPSWVFGLALVGAWFALVWIDGAIRDAYRRGIERGQAEGVEQERWNRS